MASTDLTGIAQGFMPNLTGAVSIITWGIIIVVLGLIVAVVLYFALDRRKYKYKCVVFENVNGNLVDIAKDRAQELKFGDMGITLLYFKKLKRYEPFPRVQSGGRKFYFEKKPNGMLVNVVIKPKDSPEEMELDEMSQAMIYHHTAINRGLDKRYKKMEWLKEYAPVIISVVFVIMIGVMTWLLFDKWISLANATNAGVTTAGTVMEKADAILGKLANLETIKGVGGSGYIQNTTNISI